LQLNESGNDNRKEHSGKGAKHIKADKDGKEHHSKADKDGKVF